MGAFCSGPRLGLVTPRAGSQGVRRVFLGKGTWVHVMTLDNIQCVFHIRVMGRPLAALEGSLLLWERWRVGGSALLAPQPQPLPRLEDLGLGKAQILVGKYIKLSWASIPLSLQLKAL